MVSRRSVLKSASAAAVTAALSRRGLGLAGAVASEPLVAPLRVFDYSDVTLLPGPMREQFDYHHRLTMGMDDDAMLKPFRERAGLAARGEDMGGWYSNSKFFDTHGAWEGFCPGHSFGQYVSTLARSAAITGEAAPRAKVEALVAGVAPTLTGDFFATYPLPGYVFDKICCGLIDAHSELGLKVARPLLEHTFAVASPYLPEKALSRAEMTERPHVNEVQTWDETYTMPENLFLAYNKMGRNPVFREAGMRFLEDDTYFNPLAEDVNVLPGNHAYSHVNAFSSAAQAYLTLGSEKHLRAAKNAFRMLEAQSFATGGWGPGEQLLRPGTDDLARSIFTTQASFETPCGSYAHFKITRYLLRITGDAHYGDSMERVLYNTVLGAKPLQPDGSGFYYSDYTMEGRKAYARDRWHCCAGTLPQVTTDYGISTYLGGVPGASERGISVVLYVPSRVVFQEGGSKVSLTQETLYPAQPRTSLKLEMEKDAAFPMAVRIPAWSGPGTRVSVNGKRLAEEVKPGTFLRLERTWRTGDRVEIEFDMPLRTEALTTTLGRVATTIAVGPTPPHAAGEPNEEALAVQPWSEPLRLAAVMRGPVVFMATGAWPNEMREKDLLAATVASAGDAMSVNPQAGKPIAFKPFTAIGDEAYRTYQPVIVD
jgi:hypothetical protein